MVGHFDVKRLAVLGRKCCVAAIAVADDHFVRHAGFEFFRIATIFFNNDVFFAGNARMLGDPLIGIGSGQLQNGPVIFFDDDLFRDVCSGSFAAALAIDDDFHIVFVAAHHNDIDLLVKNFDSVAVGVTVSDFHGSRHLVRKLQCDLCLAFLRLCDTIDLHLPGRFADDDHALNAADGSITADGLASLSDQGERFFVRFEFGTGPLDQRTNADKKHRHT